MIQYDLSKATPTTEHFIKILTAFKEWGITKLVIKWCDNNFLLYSPSEIHKIFRFMERNNISPIIYHNPICLSSYDLIWYKKLIDFLPKTDGTYLSIKECSCKSCKENSPKILLEKYIKTTELKLPLYLDCDNFVKSDLGETINIPKNIIPLNFAEKLGKNIQEHEMFDIISETDSLRILDLIYARDELRKNIWNIFINDTDIFEILDGINILIKLCMHKRCEKIGKIGEGSLGHSILQGVYASNINSCEGKYYIKDKSIETTGNQRCIFDKPISFLLHNWDENIIASSTDSVYKLSRNLQKYYCVYKSENIVDIAAYKNELYILKKNHIFLLHKNQNINVPYPTHKICHNGDGIVFFISRDNLYMLNPELPDCIFTIGEGGWGKCVKLLAERNKIFVEFPNDFPIKSPNHKNIIIEYKCIKC